MNGNFHAEGDQLVLEKDVNSRNYLRRYDGWAIDVDQLAALRRLGGGLVRLIDEHGDRWEAALERFDTKGMAIEFGRHGKQVVLQGRWWRRSPSGAHQATLPGVEL